MINKYIQIATVLGSMLFAGYALAHDEPPAEDPGPWSGFVQAGYTRSAGNTNASAYNVGAELNYDLDRWHHRGTALAIGSTAENDDGLDSGTSESYSLRYDVQYDINDRLYAFGDVEWKKNRFSAYDQQMFETAGVGYRILKNDRHELNGQAGIGFSQNDYRDQEPADPPSLLWGTSENQVVYVLGADYTWNFSETAVFIQTVGTKIGSDNTYSFSLSELRANLLENLVLALSYKLERNSDVPPNTKKQDSFTAISIGYTF